MKKLSLAALSFCVLASLLASVPSWAGVPLRGIGVSLGKVPGGGVATRTTDENGQANFGAQPALPKGEAYEITIGAVPENARVEVTGAGGKAHLKNIEHAVASRASAHAIRLESDGKTPLIVTVTAESALPRPAGPVKPNSN